MAGPFLYGDSARLPARMPFIGPNPVCLSPQQSIYTSYSLAFALGALGCARPAIHALGQKRIQSER